MMAWPTPATVTSPQVMAGAPTVIAVAGGADGSGLVIRAGAMVALLVVAAVIAVVLQRRRPDPPSAPSYRAPSQLDRDDFAQPDAPVLIAVFGSSTCDSCPRAWAAVEPLASDRVAVQRIDVQDNPDLHQRYRIDGVPTTIVADHEGVVAHAYFGAVTSDDLAEALASMNGPAPT